MRTTKQTVNDCSSFTIVCILLVLLCRFEWCGDAKLYFPIKDWKGGGVQIRKRARTYFNIKYEFVENIYAPPTPTIGRNTHIHTRTRIPNDLFHWWATHLVGWNGWQAVWLAGWMFGWWHHQQQSTAHLWNVETQVNLNWNANARNTGTSPFHSMPYQTAPSLLNEPHKLCSFASTWKQTYNNLFVCM